MKKKDEIEIIFLILSHEKVVSITCIAIIILTLQELKPTYYYSKTLFYYTFKCTDGLRRWWWRKIHTLKYNRCNWNGDRNWSLQKINQKLTARCFEIFVWVFYYVIICKLRNFEQKSLQRIKYFSAVKLKPKVVFLNATIF